MTIRDSDKYLTPEEIREKNKRRHWQLRRQGKAQAFHNGPKHSHLGGAHPLATPSIAVTARPKRG